MIARKKGRTWQPFFFYPYLKYKILIALTPWAWRTSRPLPHSNSQSPQSQVFKLNFLTYRNSHFLNKICYKCLQVIFTLNSSTFWWLNLQHFLGLPLAQRWWLLSKIQSLASAWWTPCAVSGCCLQGAAAVDMFIWTFFHNDIKKHEPKILYKASVCRTIVGFLYVVTRYRLLLR